MSERRYADGYRKLRKADEPRRIAYEVLHEVATQGAFANIILPKALRQARRDGHFSDRDAAFTSELVHGTLRAIGRLDWVIARHIHRPLADLDPRALVILRMGAHQLLDMRVPDHAAVSATVDVAREHLTDGPVRFVNAVLRSITREDPGEREAAMDAIADEDEALGVRYSHPAWMVAAFRDALKAHGSTLEETRADLFALYYLADPKLVELGIIDNPEAYKAEYYKYMMNGLMTQLNRIEPGKDVEEAHMRNRQLIARYILEKGKKDKVVELVKKNGKTYVKINDYKKMRGLIADLLAEIQRIKSEGDYAAGNALVNKYAVKVDPKLHKEVLKRYSTLDIPPYRGFVNPVYNVVYDDNGNIRDITIDYSEGYTDQMLRLGREFSTLK